MKYKINYYLIYHIKPFLRRLFGLCNDCNKPLWLSWINHDDCIPF